MTTEALAHRSLVALTPQDVAGAQSELASWCKGKILELSLDLRDARQNMRQAKAMLWRWQGWQRVITKTQRRMIYYAKIRAAVNAGYLVIPNLPCETIAVRVGSMAPRPAEAQYPTSINEAKPDLSLPPGRGHYVDETLPHTDLSWNEPDGKGGTKLVRHVRVDSYDETIDFPATLIKPVILGATQRAMALRIFDRIGVSFGGTNTMSSRRRRSDPIVVGQILNGAEKYPEEKMVTFFVAWWLDTRSL